MLIFYGVITEHKDKRIGGNEWAGMYRCDTK